MIRKLWLCIALLTVLFVGQTDLSVNAQTRHADSSNSSKISLAYVVSDMSGIPDASLFSHLIYAFCEFNDANDGVVISNPEKLRKMSELKGENPDLRVILGIGGYKKEGFSEMTADRKKRKAFVAQCKEIIREFNLDGIDLDWEFPGTTAGGHTAAPNDAKNYGTLVKDLRKALGKDKWISFYSNNSAAFIDFDRMLPYVDYVNVSGYNLSVPQEGKTLYHQSPLYPSEKCGNWCVSKSVARHISKGIPPQKILLGIPFFGRGITPFPSYLQVQQIPRYTEECEYVWDEEAKVPYYRDKNGTLVVGFDNEESIRIKCDFIRQNGLAGGFVWHYDAESNPHSLAMTLQINLLSPKN